jgi:hypothetical protein
MLSAFTRYAAAPLMALMIQIPLGLAGYPQVATAEPAPTLQEPESLVREVYRHLIADERNSPQRYSTPESFFAPSLKSLVAAARRKARGEAACGLDFVFWVNGQDYTITHLNVARGAASAPDRATVIATFRNMNTPEKIVFSFEHTGGRWLLDDAQSVGGDGKWTFSHLLRCES